MFFDILQDNCDRISDRNDETTIRKQIKFVQTRLGKLYACVPVEMEIEEASEILKTVCAVDPGSRCFMTIYTSDGYVFKIGTREGYKKYIESEVKKIKKLHRRLKRLKDKKCITKRKCKRRQRSIRCVDSLQFDNRYCNSRQLFSETFAQQTSDFTMSSAHTQSDQRLSSQGCEISDRQSCSNCLTKI